MQTYDKRSGQWARKVEVNIRPPIVWNVALLDYTFLFQLLVREFIRSENFLLLLFPACALCLTPKIVQVALIRLELVSKISVMVTDCLEDFIKFVRFSDNAILQ